MTNTINLINFYNLLKIINSNKNPFSKKHSQLILLKLVFYACLSHKQDIYINRHISTIKKNNLDLKSLLKNNLGYTIKPFKELRNLIAHDYSLNDLNKKFDYFNHNSKKIFEGIFNHVDFSPNQCNLVSYFIETIANICTQTRNDTDYQQLLQIAINQYLTYYSKKSYEYSNPIFLSDLMAKIIGYDSNPSSIYDPTMGTGSSLLRVISYINNKNTIVSGQEMDPHVYNLAKMNLLASNVYPNNIQIFNSNTLNNILPQNSLNKYDSVVSVPPFSEHWNGGALLDPRFQIYGQAPKAKADYAFLLDGLYHLSLHGTMAIILPTGVLFRGSKEAKIRKYLILHNNIEAIIGLPSKILYGSSIPTVMLILKKERKAHDVLFINATKIYTKRNNRRILSHNDINKIVNIYVNKKSIQNNKRISHLATQQEIQRNNYNLNIPRYIDMSHPKPLININKVKIELNKINLEIKQSEMNLNDIENKFKIRK